jgi:outer membrane protein assembly factor BamE (lipoprotein component of BamABCDE complex)
MMVPSSTRLKRAARMLAACIAITAAVGLAGCSPVKPIVDYRGYLPRSDEIARVQIGMGKTEVEALLGSPSTTATIDDLGESYYYISSVVETTAFLAPQVVDRQILAVRFDQEQRVSGLAHYGLEDGKVVNFISRETPTRGKEMSIIQQLFDNIGRFDPGAG